MSRTRIHPIALALCLTLFAYGLPRTRASVPSAPSKKEAKQKESCATCPAGQSGAKENSVNRLATMGRQTQQMPFAPVQRSLFDGARINMVGTADGSLAFAVTDLKLNGLMPLAFQRVYSSDRAEDRGLGAGWSFAYDDRVRVVGDEAVMMTGAGAQLAFRRDGEGRRFVLSTPEPGLHQSFEEADDGTLVESLAGFTRTYRQIGGEYRLARVADPNGNAVAISFDRRGNISRVEGVGGQSLTLNWSSGKRPHLLSVADNTGRRVSFAVRGKLLAAAIDQAGSRWAYEYAGGRLVGASDPLGRTVLRARYDAQGRAVEAGDAVGSHLYQYEAGGLTVVTDPLGAKLSITHTALGAVASVVDATGQTAVVEYDESNRPARVVDSLGNEQTFAREAGGKGGVAAHTYDARGNILSAQSADPAASYRAVRNGRGQPLSLKAGSGRELTFEYDAAGNATALSYSDVGRFERGYDGAGRLTSSRLPSGLAFDYEYDAHGQVARVTDNAGRVRTIERDASGLVTKTTEPDGMWVRATRDAAGRVTRMDAADGRSRQFAYDARGALNYYRDALGRQYRISYDRAGRVQKIDKSDGVSLRYRYGRDGRVASVSREVRAGAANFLPAAFSFSPRRGDAPLTDCVFDIDYYPAGSECNPYGEYGGGTTWGGGGSWGGGESRQQCIERHMRACDSDYFACISAATGASLTIIAGCSAISAGTLLLICLGIAVGADLTLVAACWFTRESCHLRAPDGCPSA